MRREEAFDLISDERERQEQKWDQAHPWGFGSCASTAVHDAVKVMVLTEECGEVARAVLDMDGTDLRSELVQVAAVAVAWLESLR